MYRVLLVEDNKTSQLVAVATLRQLGYEVDVVGGGLEAVLACADRHFDAVLMDIQMPGVDGYTATFLIRQHEGLTGHRCPIIGLSARDLNGDRDAALAADLDDYLTKPLRAQELRDTLERWIAAPVGAAR
jgi:two-component system, sensor histidine kinase and response regulator